LLVMAILCCGVTGCGGGSKSATSRTAAVTVPSPSPVYLDCERATNAAGSILGYASSFAPGNIERLVSSGERQAAHVLRQGARQLDTVSAAGGSGGSYARSLAMKLSLLATALTELSRQAAATHVAFPSAVIRHFAAITHAVVTVCPNSS
jgi:hypothetical protein